GYAYGRALFRLEQILEKPLPQEKEPLYRIKRDFPGMAAFPIQRLPGAWAGQAVLSNMPQIVDGEFVFPGYPPVSVDDLCRIAEKIPRPYPLYED
ncbi:MAG: hypothetical protein LIO46_00305, partial [Clostridiales bacterium]|nr:hypothetical protein [Clostridiales bacterium]